MAGSGPSGRAGRCWCPKGPMNAGAWTSSRTPSLTEGGFGCLPSWTTSAGNAWRWSRTRRCPGGLIPTFFPLPHDIYMTTCALPRARRFIYRMACIWDLAGGCSNDAGNAVHIPAAPVPRGKSRSSTIERLPSQRGLSSLQFSWCSVMLTPYFGPISKAYDSRVI